MKEKKKRYMLTGVLITLAVLFGTALLALGIFIHYAMNRHIEKIELRTAMAYDQTMQQTLEELETSGISVVLSTAELETTVTNPDFGRTMSTTVMGVAGDASLLFPGSNALLSDAEEYCLLGEDAAAELFGSTQINGRMVEINGKRYYVSGIIWGKDWKKHCVYQADPDDSEQMESLAFGFASVREKGIVQQKVESRLQM